ncbi:MAG TPA: FecR domain-containing protein [Lacipirellula sp.]
MNRSPLESYSAYLDGHCLGDAEILALRTWIAEDEQNAIEFVEFAALHAAVTERLRLGRLLDDLTSHRSGCAIAPSLVAEAIREIETNSPRVITALPVAEPVAETQPWWQLLAPFVAVAAMLLIGFWGLWHASEEVALPRPADPQPIAAVPVNPAPEPPKVAAALATSFDAKWAGDAKITVGEEFVEGARLNLLSGVVKLEMRGGASMVVEGPSEFTLTSADRVRLRAGKAAVRIADGGEAFIVDAPSMQVIDLGTEFGVEASATGEGQVMVFDGSVALAEPASVGTGGAAPIAAAGVHLNRLGAGFQVNVSPDQSLDRQIVKPEVLTNPRHFLRPDEIDVRLRALAGSIADQKLAAHYERQRLKGLLAYQGFDAASGGSSYTLGIGGWGLQAQGRMSFASDPQAGDGIEVQNGPVFMWLDVSSAGPFARAELLADSGRIGRAGKEVWLTWRTERVKASPEEAGSAGVSLMFGERSDADEPVFFGRGFGSSETLTVQTAWGGGPPTEGERINAKIDFDLKEPELQEGDVDDAEHHWLARIEFREGPDAVSVWLDADLASLDKDRPHSYLEAYEIEFDRIRMAVNRSDEVWRFSQFAAALDPESLYQLSKVAEFKADK